MDVELKKSVNWQLKNEQTQFALPASNTLLVKKDGNIGNAAC